MRHIQRDGKWIRGIFTRYAPIVGRQEENMPTGRGGEPFPREKRESFVMKVKDFCWWPSAHVPSTSSLQTEAPSDHDSEVANKRSKARQSIPAVSLL